jgi:ketosteroid isomerase-like protein
MGLAMFAISGPLEHAKLAVKTISGPSRKAEGSGRRGSNDSGEERGMKALPRKPPSPRPFWLGWILALGGLMAFSAPGFGDSKEDIKTVAALDTEYQLAVKNNDAATMDRILAEDFVLVTGRGKTYSKADLLDQARKKTTVYEKQDELSQKVRVWGDTAVVTALLWLKGISEGKPFERKLWFSDTYVRTPKGWKYVLGQASLPLPEQP